LKKELWARVQAGDWLIYADEYDGVHKVKVAEVDITQYEPGPPAREAQPWGLTAETGTVKIQYDAVERIENLADLIPWNLSRFQALERAWKDLQAAKATAEDLGVKFNTQVADWKA